MTDEYLELMAVAVQSLPYETDGTLTAPKFPIETYVDGKGDCDDKSLLLAGLLAREGYTVALFYFKPEAHMAVGVKGYGCAYQDTGYGYVATTNLCSWVSSTASLTGGVNLTSAPACHPGGKRHQALRGVPGDHGHRECTGEDRDARGLPVE